MIEPMPEREYQFVRRVDGCIEQLAFKRFNDGSAIVHWEDGLEIWEISRDAWTGGWSRLHSDGFVEVEQARLEGLIPKNYRWRPVVPGGFEGSMTTVD
jgi:hypothetical protein